MSGNKKF